MSQYMKTRCKLLFLISLLFLPMLASNSFALGDASYVSETKTRDSMCLVDGNKKAAIYVAENDLLGVARATTDLQKDIERVTGEQAPIINELPKKAKQLVIIGTLGASTVIDELVAKGKIDISEINGVWEGTLIQLVKNPMKGVDQALVIVGSDRRGTAYGIYDVSEQIGVSPWYFWLNAPTQTKESIYITPVRKVDIPKVKFRGIFLNDEAPALSGYVHETYDGFNHKFYVNVFELLLRLKSNFLWPAMWNNAFSDDDPQNMILAHEYGIFTSNSHHEPMMRADKEWDRYGEGPWDYDRNPERLYEFWTEGAKRHKNLDSIFTLGMRGQADTPMSETENVGLLELIVKDQRKILSEVFDDRPISEVPQVWCLYKEVQGYYERGMRVPDDVTLLWSDDNWGNIRHLPTPEERLRSGGAGVYYHFDYVGGPRSYRWMNVTQISKIWEQMNLAYNYDANKIWIVNVGDLKPMEYPIEFFLRMAYNPEAWPKERIPEFGKLMAEREFGPEHAREIQQILDTYTRANARRRPELLDTDVYSINNYNEGDRILEELHGAVAKAEEIYESLPEDAKPAFYQLVLHPIKSVCSVNEIAIYAAKNRMYAKQRRLSTNVLADKVEQAFQNDADQTEFYHKVNADGKWNHFMAQPHIGYAFWNNPPENNMPWVARVTPTKGAYMGIATAMGEEAFPSEGFFPFIPELSPFGAKSQWIDVFNIGETAFDFTATPSEDWVILSATEGTIENDLRIQVSIDWDKAPKGNARANVNISYGRGWGKSTRINVPIFNPETPTVSDADGFVEASGYVSIEAENFTANNPGKAHNWEVVPDHGLTLSSMATFPSDDTIYLNTEDAPSLEYKMYLFKEGEIEVETIVAPTAGFVPDRGLRYAIAFDDNEPMIMDILEHNDHNDWQEAVRLGVRKIKSIHKINESGYHTLKIWMVDPGVVVQKIVLNTGGLKPSYLGPEQSFYKKAE